MLASSASRDDVLVDIPRSKKNLGRVDKSSSWENVQSVVEMCNR